MTGPSRGQASGALDVVEVAAVALVAVLLGLYAGWIAADLAPRWLTIPVVIGVIWWGLFAQPTAVDRVAYGCYAAALLLALTPVLLIAPDPLRSADLGVDPWSLMAMRVNVLVFLGFLLPALVVGYVGYRFDTRRS